MLRLVYDKQLARLLETSPSRLKYVCAHAADYCEEWELYNPLKLSNDPRLIINPSGPLRQFQKKLHERVLKARLHPLAHNHGGIKGRGIHSNFGVHSASRFAFKMDISKFYPSIDQGRVHRLFRQVFECPPPVADLCTQMCTFKRALAQGMITSPMLANHIFRPADDRIFGMCECEKLKYSRFVDDITISGSFDFDKSGIQQLVRNIITGLGFELSERKTFAGSMDDGFSITGIRKNRRGNWDVQPEYFAQVLEQLEDAEGLAAGRPHPTDHPYYQRSQIRGKIRFIAGINYGRGERLLERFRRIDWEKAHAEACRQHLAICRKQLVKPGTQPTIEYAASNACPN